MSNVINNEIVIKNLNVQVYFGSVFFGSFFSNGPAIRKKECPSGEDNDDVEKTTDFLKKLASEYYKVTGFLSMSLVIVSIT